MFEWMREVSPMALIIAVFLVVGANDSRADAPIDQYVVSNGTVFDTKSQLLWEQNPPNAAYRWDEAQSRCASLSLLGTGWRLPSMKELQTIVDDSRMQPTIDVTAFPDTAWEKYWSSTVRAFDTADAWLVNFDYGGTSTEDKNFGFRARCVR